MESDVFTPNPTRERETDIRRRGDAHYRSLAHTSGYDFHQHGVVQL